VSDPRVSVLIPTRDRGGRLAGAIESALAQDVEGLEVVVCDDASTDETAEVVAGFADSRIAYHRHGTPVGVAANRNACLAVARGRYLAWLDDDDERLAGTLAAQLDVLEAAPDVALVHGGRDLVDGGGRRLPPWPAPFAHDAVEPSRVAFAHLIAANELTTSTVVVRADVQRRAGAFAARGIGRSSTDWEMWLRLALRGAVAYVAAPAARYRQHADTISRTCEADGERLRCDARVVERVLRRVPGLIGEPDRAARAGRAGVAARALLHAGDAHTRGGAQSAQAAVKLAARLTGLAECDSLREAYARGDDTASMRLTRAALTRLAPALDGTRFGARIRRAADGDRGWEAQLERAGRTARAATSPDAVLAVIAKWDPTLIRHAGRAGFNYPDRTLLPDGYPVDGDAAVAHLEALRGARGVTHLVVPAACDWWLTVYKQLAARAGEPVVRDSDCAIYALTEGP
jgi:glycosyltransferase involved in cell wall biosynthesis